MVAAFAVTAGELEEEQVANEVRYRFYATLVLADTAVRTVSMTHDSVFARFPQALSRTRRRVGRAASERTPREGPLRARAHPGTSRRAPARWGIVGGRWR